MRITDRLYGTIDIKSDLLISLLQSKSLLRLKGIAQFGIPDEYYIHTNYSRFEHCVGVMLLLWLLGAPEEEQAAGLLHDVSHTAFSHVIDWVLGPGKTENYQDEHHASYILSSEIPGILKDHGLSAARIIDYHNFSLLEKDIPELCADRIDYSLREFPVSVAGKCIRGLIVVDRRIVCKSKSIALLFATRFLKQQMTHWGGFEAMVRFKIFADVLRLAIKEKIITENDFWKDDLYILNKVKAAKIPEIQKNLRILTSKSLAGYPKGSTVIHKKFRYIDPLFVQNGGLIRLSASDPDFLNLLEEARIKNEQGARVPAI